MASFRESKRHPQEAIETVVLRWAGALVALVLLMSGAEAQRQSVPYDLWCRDQPTLEGSVTICQAYTLQQCLASRTSPGESCYLNPRYDPRFRR
jgi:hypothetical protein